MMKIIKIIDDVVNNNKNMNIDVSGSMTTPADFLISLLTSIIISTPNHFNTYILNYHLYNSYHFYHSNLYYYCYYYHFDNYYDYDFICYII